MAGHRTIGAEMYPTMSFDGSFDRPTVQSFEGLYLDWFPADFAERHRFYSFVWLDLHPPDVLGTSLAKFDAIVSSAHVRPLGTVLLSSDFSNPQDGVIIGAGGDPGRAETGYTDGEYKVLVLDRQFGHPAGGIAGTIFDNVGVAVTATVVSQDPYPYVMVACRRRADAETGYRLSIRPGSAEFLIDRVDGDGIVDLVGWQQSLAIHAGNEPNRLELRCAGTTISALVNDIEVASVEDATYGQGLVWFAAGASAGSTVDARFANFAVTQR